MPEADARSILEAAGLATAAGQLERARDGRRNEVWLGADVVVRLLADPTRLPMEVALLERVAAAGTAPVAEVLWWSAERTPAAMVQRRLPGRRLSEFDAPSRQLRDDVVATLRAIHDIPATEGGFGNLTADLRGEDLTLGTWFVDRVRAEAGTTGPEIVARALGVLEAARPLLDAQPSGLVHGDLQPTNLLVDGDRVTGVLDWEAAKAGPPALDLGWWDWWGTVAGTPWPLDEPADDDEAALRRLVQVRVELRELLHGRGGDGHRLRRLLDGAA